MPFESQILQYILSGLVVGAIYAIVGVGFVTIYSVTGIINFAQGEFVMLGAMVMVSLHHLRLSTIPAFVITVLFVTLVGALLERTAIHPARRASVLTLIIITIGASIAVRGAALLAWGTDPFPLPPFTKGSPITIMGAVLVRQGLWIMGTTVVLMAGLYLFLGYTIWGKAFRACAINAPIARLMGISVTNMSLLSFGLSASLGAIAGMVVVPITYGTYDMGTMLGLKGFVAAIMGGLASAPATVVGGLLLGVFESLGAGLIHSGYKDSVAFIILLIMLVLRPGGLFSGRREEARYASAIAGVGHGGHAISGQGRGVIPLAILGVLLFILPLFVKSSYYLGIMIFFGINAMVALGLCLLMGYAGQVSLGHAAFYGIGSYISAILSASYGLPPLLSLVAAAAMSGVIAYLVGVPILRLRGNFLAMATLGLGIIVYMVFVNWVDVTGGPSGLTAIPYIKVGGFAFNRDLRYFYLVWAVALGLFLFSFNLVNSSVGRALRSIHGSELAADTTGVDTTKYKAKVFVLSAVYASLAGSLYAHYLTFINPSPFGFKYSIELVVMVVVGGIANLWGALLGAGLVTVLAEVLRAVIPRFLGHASGEYEIIVFGVILMVVMIFMPQGLMGKLSELKLSIWGWTR